MMNSVLVKQAVKDIEKKRNSLITRSRAKGIWENFGQKELRYIEDKYSFKGTNEEQQEIMKLILKFNDWCETYSN